MKCLLPSLLLAIGFFGTVPTACATAVPPVELETVQSGFDSPVAVRHPGDGSDRLFVVEQDGRIELIQSNGTVATTPFLDLSDDTGSGLTNQSGERGLLGLAFHPQFAANQLFFVNYTNTSGDTVIAQYSTMAGTMMMGDPDQADPASATILLTIGQDFSNHNGGDIHFGPDGYLYIGMGDGGSGGDPNNRAQQADSLLGKMLRIDVDNPGANATGGCGPVGNYGIPPDNPFIGDNGTCSETAVFGLRNPFRFSFDSLTGDLFIGDVGQRRVEEVDFLAAADLSSGPNFGWDCREGNTDYPLVSSDPGFPDGDAPECAALEPSGTLIDPILVYDSFPSRCSVSGGYRYRGPFNALQGIYFFSDFCTGEIFAGTESSGTWGFVVVSNIGGVPGFGEDENGDVFVIEYGSGTIYRLTTPTLFLSGFE